MEKNQVRKYFSKPRNSMDPSGIYTWTLRELANVIARSLDYYCLNSWKSAWGLEKSKHLSYLQENRTRARGRTQANTDLSASSHYPEVVTEQILETISRHMKDMEVISQVQSAFTGLKHDWKSCLTNLTTFYCEMTGLVVEERTVHVVYLQWGFWHYLPQDLH